MMRKVEKVTGGLTRRHYPGETGKMVKYTPCSRQEMQLVDDDLEDVAVISNAEPGQVTYGSGSITANGPRVVPGIITSDRGRVIGERLNNSGTKMDSPLNAGKSTSKQSLINTSSKPNICIVGGGSSHTEGRGGFVNKAPVSPDFEIPTKKAMKKKDSKSKFERWETSTNNSNDRASCKWTFVFDPSGKLSYYWSMIVSVAFLYNFWVIIYRFSFEEINPNTLVVWFTLDYIADFIYVIDIAFHFRTGYLEEGVLQTDGVKLRTNYFNSSKFYIDCLCLLPLDFLYLSLDFKSILRVFRLFKIYRFWTFLDRTERHTNYPNVCRALTLVHYMLVIFHWNACLFHVVIETNYLSTRHWKLPELNATAPLPMTAGNRDVVRIYLHSMYWSTLALTNIGDLPRPRTKQEYMFVIVQLVFGLFLFATVLGHVANIVTNVSAAGKEFQAKLDGVKTYMRMRRVPAHLQNKVIRWFDYLWLIQKSSDEERAVSCLPDKLKAEIAIHVHLDTLKRVEIFQNTEAGFLCELVLKLRPVLFSPGDYICRKGEVGKEMYIVNRGRLQVVADNGRTVLATLKAGSYFGEISILNMGTAGNRRTASVRSVGYSDLFCLSKNDMWDVLKEYPAARVRLEAIACKRLEKYKKEPLEKLTMRSAIPLPPLPALRRPGVGVHPTLASIARSQSTPGLVESSGRIPLEQMYIPPVDTIKPFSRNSGSSSDRRGLGSPVASTSSRSSTFTGETGSEDTPKPLFYPIVMPLRAQQRHYGGAAKSTTTGSVNSYDSDKKSSSVPPPLATNHRPFRHPDNVAHWPGAPKTLSANASLPRLESSSPEILLAEIKRLRDRLVTLETENTAMSIKLSQQQWEVENRLTEIELQICGGDRPPSSSGSSPGSPDENERNKESII